MAMEDFRVDVVIGKGPGATAIPLEIPPFTLVGATTRAGLLPGPLRDRFGFTGHLEYYEPARARPDRAPLGRPARRRGQRRGRRRDRVPLARHPAHRQPAAAPGARLRPGPRRRRRHPRRSPRPTLELYEVDQPRPGPARPRACSTSCAAASAAARSASRRWPSPWGRSARPSRRSPSRSWSATASWPARRAVASPPPPPGPTSASPPRRRPSLGGARTPLFERLSRRPAAGRHADRDPGFARVGPPR